MKNNEEILDLFENYLAQIQLPEEPQRLYKPILYSMSGGGKRIRPSLLMLVCDAYGGSLQDALPVAAAVEMFHNFTLLHDDIMDNATVRRGKPSVYASWGDNVAILSGDAMMIYSYRMLHQAPPTKLHRIMDIFTTMALQVCEGQQYDMDFESLQKVSVVEYMNMIELKTSVLLAGSAMIGAVLGDASEEDCRRVYRYALELGLAFQQQDDLLDSYGTQEELGKRIGGDILEGKKTCLMLNAMSRATEADREILRTAHLNESLTDAQKIACVKGVYDRYDIPHLINQQISTRFDRALSILDTLELAPERTEHLRTFAQNLMGRKK
jgi:geranylgeranyl diphosphate synthase type II